MTRVCPVAAAIRSRVYVANTTTRGAELPDPESTYGTGGKERDAFYDGVNFNVNARMRNGLFVSIGTQTGRRVDDRCHVRGQLQQRRRRGPNPRDCRDIDPWETTIRGPGQLHHSEDGRAGQRDGALAGAAAAIGANWQVPNTMIRDRSAASRRRVRSRPATRRST